MTHCWFAPGDISCYGYPDIRNPCHQAGCQPGSRISTVAFPADNRKMCERKLEQNSRRCPQRSSPYLVEQWIPDGNKPKETTIMQNHTSARPPTHSLSRRGFLSSGALAFLSMFVPSLGKAKTPTKRKIAIPEFDEAQVRSKVLQYSQNGWEPTLAVILGVLISWRKVFPARGSAGQGTTKSFFSETRVRRILEYAASDNADPRVLAALQTELDPKGRRSGQTPQWLCYSVWFKGRIIRSFDESVFECSYTDMIIDHQPKIEELVRWPLRELE